MAPKNAFLYMLAIVLASLHIAAADPDILVDYIVPPNATNVTADYFTYTGLRGLIGGATPANFTLTIVSMFEFPALNGQSVSYAFLQFPPLSVNSPHSHPRGSEILLLLSGRLDIFLVDTDFKLFTTTLDRGDMFLFPKGLVHYQYNSDPKNPATALAAFGSANFGRVTLPQALFTTSVPDIVLAKSFQTDIATIQKIKNGLVGSTGPN
ncbi:hypothetical protein RJ639_032321 [Escallonia herrerae]|uniref:Germin-like protein n=1 Tax=Escallonia herrerae TaxID=1293975 RepID=A0AA89BKB8_9ASTE|nr:hypothetical protein RJ639_032321 [Escallonia herrerae]